MIPRSIADRRGKEVARSRQKPPYRLAMDFSYSTKSIRISPSADLIILLSMTSAYLAKLQEFGQNTCYLTLTEETTRNTLKLTQVKNINKNEEYSEG